jgi:hypothetical protein
MSTIKQRLLDAIDRSPVAELENTLLFLEDRLTLNQFQHDYPAKAVSILKQLAQNNACANIEDPIVWQTELRTDRPLPFSNKSEVIDHTIAHQLFTQLGAAWEIEKLELRMENFRFWWEGRGRSSHNL